MTNTQSIIKTIKNRKTSKGLSDVPLQKVLRDHKLIETLIESAYWAPFHKTCHQVHQKQLSAIMPWRFHILDSEGCRKLSQIIQDEGLQMGKIQSMLNCADYLIQATWTPNQTNNSDQLFCGSIENMEHIAAASAAIQNILLTATALDLKSYWSSGGVLRDRFVFDQLQIPHQQILLGAVFIFPNETSGEINFVDSKLREKRSDINETYRFISL